MRSKCGVGAAGCELGGERRSEWTGCYTWWRRESSEMMVIGKDVRTAWCYKESRERGDASVEGTKKDAMGRQHRDLDGRCGLEEVSSGVRRAQSGEERGVHDGPASAAWTEPWVLEWSISLWKAFALGCGTIPHVVFLDSSCNFLFIV